MTVANTWSTGSSESDASNRTSNYYIRLAVGGAGCGLTPDTKATRDSKTSTSRQTRGASGTILVVEDEEILRVVVSKVLRERGFSVIEASDGRVSVELFRTNKTKVSVVVLDITLPSMSGNEVLAELRRIRPDVKVIVTTAYSDTTISMKPGHQPPWRFLRKPYHISELVGLVRDAVG